MPFKQGHVPTNKRPVNHDLAARVRAARQARGWTQRELADECGLYPRTIRRLEAGRVITGIHDVLEVLGLDDTPCDACGREILDGPDPAGHWVGPAIQLWSCSPECAAIVEQALGR